MTAVAEHRTDAARALAANGFTGERLQRLARKVAHDELRASGAALDSRFDDLVSTLCLDALRATLRYEPATHRRYGRNGGDPFESYLADIMKLRIKDFFRRKSEGFGDRRRGLDGRIVLGDELVRDAVEVIEPFEAERLAYWIRGAEADGLPLRDWIGRTLDRRARFALEQGGVSQEAA